MKEGLVSTVGHEWYVLGRLVQVNLDMTDHYTTDFCI